MLFPSVGQTLSVFQWKHFEFYWVRINLKQVIDDLFEDLNVFWFRRMRFQFFVMEEENFRSIKKFWNKINFGALHSLLDCKINVSKESLERYCLVSLALQNKESHCKNIFLLYHKMIQ